MQKWWSGLFLIHIFGCSGCSPPLNPETGSVSLRAQSGAPLTALPRVTRLVLGGAGQIPLEDLWLVVGEVGSSTEGRVKRRDLPASLVAARQALFSYREGGETIVAPSGILTPGATYSLFALGVGVIGSVTIAPDSSPVLRHWGDAWVHEGEPLRYCLGEPPMATLTSSEFLPEGLDIEEERVTLGFDDSAFGREICLRVEPAVHENGIVLPPTSAKGWLLDPLPLSVLPQANKVAVDCELSCAGSSLSGACIRNEQGVFLVEFCPGAYLLRASLSSQVQGETRYHLLSPEGGRTSVVGPLRSDELYTITVARLDAQESATETIELLSGPADSRLVLTEVLTNPIGPEPQSEWIELQNVGTLPASLLGLEIWDDAGGTPLPGVSLDAGQIGLIVREDFKTGADLVPAPDAVPIVVSEIGHNGLRNSGEEVSLRDGEGNVLSRIPAKNTPEGISSLRISPWAPDSEDSFVEHPAPGASPGY